MNLVYHKHCKSTQKLGIKAYPGLMPGGEDYHLIKIDYMIYISRILLI